MHPSNHRWGWSPTHWCIQPPTHPPMGGGVSTNHKSSNRIELSWFGQHFKIFLVIWPDPTHQPTHPPNHTPTHGWGILYRCHIFKQNQIILISWSVIKCLLIPGVPLGVVGVDWDGGMVGVCGVSHACMHAHTCTHACAHVWRHPHQPAPSLELQGAQNTKIQ